MTYYHAKATVSLKATLLCYSFSARWHAQGYARSANVPADQAIGYALSIPRSLKKRRHGPEANRSAKQNMYDRMPPY